MTLRRLLLAIGVAGAIIATQREVALAQCHPIYYPCDIHAFLPIGIREPRPTPTRLPPTPAMSPVAPSPVPSATPMPTSPPQPTAGVACTNHIRNGGFEEQPRGIWWHEYSVSGEPIIRTDQPYRGGWSAWFGGYSNAEDMIMTTYTIPHRAADRGRPGDLIGGKLTYVWGMESQELTSGVYDALIIALADAKSDEVKLLSAHTNQDPRNRWYQREIDVTQQLVRTDDMRDSYFAIYAKTDDSLRTSWFIDEIVLEICYRTGGDRAKPMGPVRSPAEVAGSLAMAVVTGDWREQQRPPFAMNGSPAAVDRPLH